MKNEKEQLTVLKAVFRAKLTNTELKLVVHLLTKHDSTITAKNTELSKQTGIATPNIIRAIKSLTKKNVLGHRPKTDNLFVKSLSQWKA
jgi:DNA-binding MarR family transcriptional regulator